MCQTLAILCYVVIYYTLKLIPVIQQSMGCDVSEVSLFIASKLKCTEAKKGKFIIRTKKCLLQPNDQKC